MSAVVKFVKDVVKGAGDVVGDVFESAGDAVESVGDAIADAGSWVNDNVVQPILDDPIGFTVTTVAGIYFGPVGAFVAQTAVSKSHGDSWDDSLKSGATAGVAQWAGNAASNYAKTGNFGSSIASATDDAISSIYKSGADDVVTGALNANQVNVFGADDFMGPSQPYSYADDLMGPSAPSQYDDLFNQTKVPKDPFSMADDITENADEFFDAAKSKAAMPETLELKSTAYEAPEPVFDIGKSINESGGYKPFIPDDMPANVPPPIVDKSIDSILIDDRSFPGDPSDAINRAGTEIVERGTWAQPGETSFGTAASNLGSAISETVGSWVWDGAKWVWDNPMTALLGATALLGSGGGGPGDDGGKKTTTTDDNKTESDKDFYSDLEQLTLNRSRQADPFGRSENPYESDIYKYAMKGGEHQFYTPTTYDSSTPVQAATGGSIGALNSQQLPYYRYGAMPMAMAQGGYAQGGLNSVKEDGRSDHIPAMLSDGEYVIDAETVALLGNGSNKAGANRLEQMRQGIRKQKGGALSKGQFSPNARSPLSYIKQRG